MATITRYIAGVGDDGQFSAIANPLGAWVLAHDHELEVDRLKGALRLAEGYLEERLQPHSQVGRHEVLPAIKKALQ